MTSDSRPWIEPGRGTPRRRVRPSGRPWVAPLLGSILAAAAGSAGASPGPRLTYRVQLDRAAWRESDRIATDLVGQLGRAGGPGVTSLREGPDRIILRFADPAGLRAGGALLAAHGDRIEEVGQDRAAGRVTLRVRTGHLDGVRERAVRRADEILRERVAGFGVRGAVFRRVGAELSVQLPAMEAPALARLEERIALTTTVELKLVDDASDYHKALAERVAARGPVSAATETHDGGPRGPITVHYLRSRSREALAAFLASLPAAARPPDDHEIVYEKIPGADETSREHPGVAWRTQYVWRRPVLTGEEIDDVQQIWDEKTGQPIVTFAPSASARRAFADWAAERVGQRLAVVIDDVSTCAPVLMAGMVGHEVVIRLGGAPQQRMLEEARFLAAALRAGPLIAPLRKVHEESAELRSRPAGAR